MWIKDFFEEADNPYQFAPFVNVTHLCYLDTIADWEYPWHAHRSDFEVTVIVKGEGLLFIDEKSTPVKTGDVCVVVPGTYHRYSVPDGNSMEYFVIRFSGQPADGDLQKAMSAVGPAAVAPAGKYLDYLQSAIDLILDPVAFGDRKFIQTTCLSFLMLCQGLLSNRAMVIESKGCSASDIMQYITEHCQERITLQSLGERFCISPSHLSRMFSAAFHSSPINYLITARMARATEYLGKTDKPISEIASLVGYDNQFYFVSLFTKRIGCSPAEYRERLSSRDLPKRSGEIFPT